MTCKLGANCLCIPDHLSCPNWQSLAFPRLLIPSADALEVSVQGNTLEVNDKDGCILRIQKVKAVVVCFDGDTKLFTKGLEEGTRQ